MSRNNRLSNWQVRSVMGLLVAFVVMLLVGLTAPFASAQTQTRDNPDDLVKGVGNQGSFVAASVKANSQFMQKNPNIEQQLRDSVTKLKGQQDTRIAVISNASFPTNLNPTDRTSTEKYATQVFNLLPAPRPQVLVMVNAENQIVSLLAPKLSDEERRTLISDTNGIFATQSITVGTIDLAERAVNKIVANETKAVNDKKASDSASLFTTLAIVVVVLLAIVGGAVFLLNNTKKQWKQKVAGLEQLANQVSDQVVRVSDAVNFLPEATKVQTDADFGTATQNFSDANTQLRELQGVSPVTLLLKGPDYQRKLDLTGAQFEQTRQALTRVEQQVRSLPGL